MNGLLRVNRFSDLAAQPREVSFFINTKEHNLVKELGLAYN